MKRMFVNPFLMFAATFLYVIIAFNFKLSGFYEGIEIKTLNILFFIFIIVSFFIGVIYNYTLLSKFNFYERFKFIYRYKSLSAFILVFGFLLECVNNGGVPLFMVFKGGAYDYTQFGIKTFHVFYMGYLSASVIVNFERFLRSRYKYYLITPIIGLAITILIMNRGATFLLLFPMGLMYLSMLRVRFGFKHLNIFIVGLLGIIFLFGILGDKRMLASGYQNENVIMDIGRADPFFKVLPTGFFWTYLYSTSPFANLNLQLNVANVDKGTLDDFIAGVILPDFISKYTDPTLLEHYDIAKITPELNVGTGFSAALVIFGFIGVIMLFFWVYHVQCFFYIF